MKSTDADAVASVLRKVADAIKRCNETEWEAILNGEFRVEVITHTGSETRRRRRQDESDQPDIIGAAEQLMKAADRESGFAILDAECKSKDQLITLARHLDLPLQKREPIERLREKIVESTIGFRLRSRAIQGRPGESQATGSITGSDAAERAEQDPSDAS